ncbi:MAG: MATE family efflux transporter [bacterium]|nr:MATE family efflux transporter [bacterium]
MMSESSDEKDQKVKEPPAHFSNQLLSGGITKNIITLALPILAANIIANAYYIIDMIFVGRLGPEALAAVSMGGILMSFTWTMLVGLAIGTSSFIARYYGAKDVKMVTNIARHSILIAVVIAAVLAAYGLFGSEPSLKLLGAEGEVLRLGTSYTKIVFCGSFFLMLLFVVNSMFRGTGDTRTPMITLGISSIINIILDPLLIFGLGPFPQLGVTGAAIATVIGQGIGAVMNLIILYKGFSRITIRSWRFKPELSLMKSVIKVALPGSIQTLIQTASGLVIMRLVTAYGTIAVAAYGIGLRLDLMVMLPGWALGAAVATVLGQNLGAKQPDRAGRAGWHGVRIYFVMLIVLCCGLWFGAKYVITAFNSDPGVISIGVEYIRTVSIGYLFLSVALILTMSMNGAGYTFVPMIIVFAAVIGYRIPLALFASITLDMGTRGLWYAISTSIFVHALLAAIWYNKGKWKLKKMH